MQLKQVYIVLCEGPSERNYVQELNRLLTRQFNYPFTFVAKELNGGSFWRVVAQYRTVRRANAKLPIVIWVDQDLYLRNELRDGEFYRQKSNKIPDFLFSKFNFEDFLVLHLREHELRRWQEICKQYRHLVKPLYAFQYLKLFRRLFPHYHKAELPFKRLTIEMLYRVFRNNRRKEVAFHCDFATFVEKLMQQHTE